MAETQTLEMNGAQSVALEQKVKDTSQKLDRFGGFKFLETIVEGSSGMNPERRARKRIFVTEDTRKPDRKALLKRIEMWKEVLTKSDNIGDMVEFCMEESEKSDALYKKNLKVAIEKGRKLEQSYRTVDSFYKNSGKDKVNNITIVNASDEQARDLSDPRFIQYVSDELKDSFEKLNLKKSYGLLVIPGFLGKTSVLDKWARIAFENKTMLVTDYRHMDDASEIMEEFDNDELTGFDDNRGNVIMTCNYIKSRPSMDEIGEEDHLYIPPSAALAGRMHDTSIAQVCAGYSYGKLYETDQVCFDMRTNQLADLQELGLIPMIKSDGQVMAFSSKTLFTGDNVGKQVYSVVRVFDWFTKVMIDYLNKEVFKNISKDMLKQIRSQIVKFYNKNKGHGRLIEDFEILDIVQDPNQKDRVIVNVHIIPYFPAKNMVIKLSGIKADNSEGYKWKFEE